jgi:hypothetical protein
MSKNLLNFGVLLLLVAGCKMSAFNQQTEPANANASPTPVQTPAQAAKTGADHAPAEPEKTAAAATPRPAAANAVCPDPEKPCQHREKTFDEWELSFKMPARLKANTPYSSAPFYAVILKTYPMEEECDGGEYIERVETDRRREQRNQLERKVFASYQCPNMASVGYDFDGRKDASGENVALGVFIALYAGESRAEAEETLRFMKSEYPQAQLKQMTAYYEKIEQ